MTKQELLPQILRFCYGDSRLTATDLERIVEEGDLREKRKLVDRLLRYHPDPVLVLTNLFSEEELRNILDSLTEQWSRSGERGPTTQLRERLLLVRNCLLGERNPIPRLAWKKL